MEGAIINAMHESRWANWMWAVKSYNASNNTIMFGNGGFQESRGALHDKGGDWFVENVYEEFDSPNEFFWEKATQKLFFYHVKISKPLSSAALASLARLDDALACVVSSQRRRHDCGAWLARTLSLAERHWPSTSVCDVRSSAASQLVQLELVSLAPDRQRHHPGPDVDRDPVYVHGPPRGALGW